MSVEPLVTAAWLADHLGHANLRILDIRGSVTTRLAEPGVEVASYQGNPEAYAAGHIPGSVFVDWTIDIIDHADPVPVQLARPDDFARAMAERGVGDLTHVVAVDAMGGQFATRLWWALRTYGHDQVSVLDGGWNRWVEDGHPISTSPVAPIPAQFTPQLQPGWRWEAADLAASLGTADLQIIDARDEGQYTAARRRGPRGGHIPGAIHLPRELFFAATGGFRPLDEIRALVERHGLQPNTPVVAYCNGGVAATVPLFHLARLGFNAIGVYDGSWNEWSGREDLPVAV